MTVPVGARRLWLSQAPFEPEVEDGDILVVLDPTWTPGAAVGASRSALPVRSTLETTLRGFDPITETSTALDAWALGASVVDAMTIGGTSIWYYRRLHHWQWLQERILWAHVLRRLLADRLPTTIVCGRGASDALLDVARIMARAS
jgi:hypothetical protein